MNLTSLDWGIIIVMLTALVGITVYGQRFNHGVSDFLAANRLAGRYLLTVSSGFGGAISIVAAWEATYHNGLATSWWGNLAVPLGLIISLTGFVIYRFRETRALTLAQFFEMRYSRKFRLFSGFLCWTSGILNYGIFPAVTARFILYFLHFPEAFQICGVTIYTFPLIMFVYLGIAVYIACAGGQICIMLTDFLQGMFLLIIFVVIMFYLLFTFGWTDIVDGLKVAPAGKSMLNPFDTGDATDFNIWYYLIGLVGTVYSVRAWQGSSGYNSAARTPHEAVMANIVGSWRGFAQTLCMFLIPLCAYAVLHSAKFAEAAAPLQAHLDSIADPTIRNQMTVPLFLSYWLPAGLTGLFAVVIIACAISCDDTYIHAWGTIFIQDVVMPFRKKPFEPKQHIRILRFAIIGVAAFGFTFSMLFPLKDFILMYFAITGAIYVGGAGAVILGGLYWKRGSAPAAWTAMIVGTTIGVGGIVLQQIWSSHIVPSCMNWYPDSAWLAANQDKFPVNGQWISFFTMVASSASYVLVSLLGPKHVHNMDKLFHRGDYADEQSEKTLVKEKFKLVRFIGINSNFTRMDRLIAYATFAWSMGWWLIFLVVSGIALTVTLSVDFWVEYWWWKLIPFAVILGTGCTIWISIGGIRDAIRLFRDLRVERVDTSDNGFVENSDND